MKVLGNLAIRAKKKTQKVAIHGFRSSLSRAGDFQVVDAACLLPTVDGRNPKQPPGM